MPLSSNSIVHFTRDRSKIEGILDDNFHLKYCHETVRLGSAQFDVVIPMVSFCDIPLSQIKNHILSYGEYGIGLTKRWAIKNKHNPVLYIEPESNLADSYENVFRRVMAPVTCPHQLGRI